MAPILYYASATFVASGVASKLLIGLESLAIGFDPGVNEVQAEV